MRFNAKILKSIFGGTYYNISNEYEFSFIDIAKPTGELQNRIDTSKQLYFAYFEKNTDGWYENDFDKKSYVDVFIRNNPDGSILTDDENLRYKYSSSYRVVKVRSILESIQRLYVYVLEQVKPSIIAFTGSVGKTTSVALMEDILITQGSVLRLYSKRITPLLLYSMVINFLEKYHDFITLEMSMYRSDHVGKLACLLPPDVAAILNIGDSHLGMEDIKTHQDIFNSKIQIFKERTMPFINADDNTISNSLSVIKKPYTTFGMKEKNKPNYRAEMLNGNLTIYKNGDRLFDCRPFLQTSLSVSQISACTAIGDYLGISNENIVAAVNKFKPKEHRLNIFRNINRTIVFDGEVTISARLRELSYNYYEDPVLVVTYAYTSSDTPEAINNQREQITKEIYQNFKMIYVASGSDPQGLFPLSSKNIETFCPKDFNKLLSSLRGTIFLHHAYYYREDPSHNNSITYFEIKDFLLNNKTS